MLMYVSSSERMRLVAYSFPLELSYWVAAKVVSGFKCGKQCEYYRVPDSERMRRTYGGPRNCITVRSMATYLQRSNVFVALADILSVKSAKELIDGQASIVT